MFGTIKKLIGHGVAAVERAVVPPAPLRPSLLDRRVVLLGASVAELWHVEVRYPNVSVRTLYTFDKSPELQRLFEQPALPDAVIVKQCAAYFPIPLGEKKGLILGWLDRLEEAGVAAILATVVPVTQKHDRAEPGRLDGLLEYNAWIRDVAVERSLPVLDLEAALRVGPRNPHLDERWATRDGLHLRRAAYRERLDPILLPVLVAALGDGES